MASDVIRGSCGRDATLSEIAVATELSEEEILFAINANSMVDSIDRTITTQEGDHTRVGEFVKAIGREQEHVENRLLLSELFHVLNEQELMVIRMRYYEDKTQMEIGRLLHISQVQVSRLEKRALKKMREA